jgi:hypothetical protein
MLSEHRELVFELTGRIVRAVPDVGMLGDDTQQALFTGLGVFTASSTA